MGVRRKWAFTMGLVAAAAACCTCLLVCLMEGGEFKPQATLTMIGCDWTNRPCLMERELIDPFNSGLPFLRFSASRAFLRTQAETNMQIVVVRVRLENRGTEPMVFQSPDGVVPFYWCRIEREGVWMDMCDFYFTGGIGVLDVGKAVEFSVSCPPGTTAWRLAFIARSAGPRLMTGRSWSARGWRGWLPETLLRLLPIGRTTSAEVMSDVFRGCVSGTERQVRVVREVVEASHGKSSMPMRRQ